MPDEQISAMSTSNIKQETEDDDDLQSPFSGPSNEAYFTESYGPPRMEAQTGHTSILVDRSCNSGTRSESKVESESIRPPHSDPDQIMAVGLTSLGI